MKKKNMTSKDIEEIIKQKQEVDNKQAINALKQKQRDEMKNLRSELAKKKRQEKAELTKKVGEEFMKIFKDKNMSFEDYTGWMKELVDCYNSVHKKDNAQSNA